MAASETSVERILDSSSGDERDALKLELLQELQRGRPIGDLNVLLKAADPGAVKAGVWVASELGAAGKPLLADVVPLLEHPDPTVRFFALDCILLWASTDDGPALARAAAMLEDPSQAVRWKAMQVLSRASETQLATASASMLAPAQKELLGWLLGPGARDRDLVIAQLESHDPLARLYGAVAAARLASVDRLPLSRAAESVDDDVRTFAHDMLS